MAEVHQLCWGEVAVTVSGDCVQLTVEAQDVVVKVRLEPDMADEVGLYLIERAAEAREVAIGS